MAIIKITGKADFSEALNHAKSARTQLDNLFSSPIIAKIEVGKDGALSALASNINKTSAATAGLSGNLSKLIEIYNGEADGEKAANTRIQETNKSLREKEILIQKLNKDGTEYETQQTKIISDYEKEAKALEKQAQAAAKLRKEQEDDAWKLYNESLKEQQKVVSDTAAAWEDYHAKQAKNAAELEKNTKKEIELYDKWLENQEKIQKSQESDAWKQYNADLEQQSRIASETAAAWEEYYANQAKEAADLEKQTKREVELYDKWLVEQEELFKSAKQNMPTLRKQYADLEMSIKNAVDKYPSGAFNDITSEISKARQGLDDLDAAFNSGTVSQDEYVRKSDEAREKLRNLKQQFSETKTDVDKLSNSTNILGDSLANIVLKIVAWQTINATVAKAIRAFTDAIATMKALDTEMVNVQKVTSATSAEMEVLEESAYRVASAYGRTADEVAQAYTTFARAGYTDQIQSLSEIALLTQNAGDVTADLASKFLVAADAAWRLGGSEDELMKILDGMNNVTNQNAVDLEALTNGITVAASVFAEAGESAQDFTALVGTGVATTQLSGNDVARGLRTILMNIRQIRGETEDGELIDDESIANAAVALKSFAGISTMADGELRKASDVLDELGGKWDSLNSVAQSAIAEALGGKYRANILTSIMSNWEMVGKMAQEYADGAGSALQENEKYMDSWEAKTKILSATWTEFIAKTIDVDWIKGLLDGLTALVVGFDNLGNVVLIVLGALAVSKWSNITKAVTTFCTVVETIPVIFSSAKGGVAAFDTAMKGLNLTLTASQLILGAVVAAISIATVAYNNYKQKQEELRQEQIETGKAAKNEADEVIGLYQQYAELKKAVADGTGSESDLKTVAEQLTAKLNEQRSEVEKLSGSYNDLAGEIEGATAQELKNKLYDAKAGTAAAGTNLKLATKDMDYIGLAAISSGYSLSQFNEDISSADGILRIYDKLIQRRNELLNSGKEEGKEYQNIAKYISELQPLVDEYNSSLESQEYLQGAVEAAANGTLDKYLAEADAMDEAAKSANNLADAQQSVKKTTSEILTGINDNVLPGLKALQGVYDDIADAAEEGGEAFDWSSILSDEAFTSAFSGLGEVYDNFIETVSNSPKDIKKCQDAFNKLSTAYLQNSDAMKSVTAETRNAVIQMLEMNGVSNAAAVVDAQLAQNEAQLAAEKVNVTNTTMAEVTELYKEQDALLAASGASETTRQALAKLVLEKIAANTNVIKTSADIQNLIDLANTAGTTMKYLQALQKVKEKVSEYEAKAKAESIYSREHQYYYARANAYASSASSTIADIIKDLGTGTGSVTVPQVKYTGTGTASSNTKDSTKSSSSSSKTEDTTDHQLAQHKSKVSLLESELGILEKQNASEDVQVAKIKQIQSALHAQAEYMRGNLSTLKAQGATQEELIDYQADINALSEKWLDYQEQVYQLMRYEATLEAKEADTSLLEANLDLLEKMGGSYSQQVAMIKQIQANLHDEAETRRGVLATMLKQGATAKEIADYQRTIVELSSEWWSWQERIEELESQYMSDLDTEVQKLLDQKKDAIDAQIGALDEQLDALKAARDTRNDQLTLEEKILAVQEAQLALADAQNERNVRYYNASTGKWEWGANKGNVKSAQEALDEAEQDLEDYKEELEYESAVAEIEAQKKALQAQYDALQDEWDAVVKSMEKPAEGIVKVLTDIWKNATPELKQIILDNAELFKALGIDIYALIEQIEGATAAVANKTVVVDDSGKAPSGLSVGDKVVTDGGTYEIVKVNEDGTYESELVDKNTTRSNYSGGKTVVVGDSGKAPSGLSVGDKVVTDAGTYIITKVNDDGSYQSKMYDQSTTRSNYSGSSSSSSTSSGSSSSGSSSSGSSSSGSSSSGNTTIKVYVVGESGSAPSGLSTGTYVLTGGGLYKITGTSGSGGYTSQLVTSKLTSKAEGVYGKEGWFNMTVPASYGIYDSGGVLSGIGGIKATNRDEMVLPPDITEKMLKPNANDTFNQRLGELGMLYGSYRVPTQAGGSSVSNSSVGTQYNGDVITVNGMTFPMEQAKNQTLGELVKLSRMLGIHNPA